MKREGLFAKRAAAMLLAIALCLCICACEGEKDEKSISKVLFPDEYEYEYDENGRIVSGISRNNTVRKYEYGEDGKVQRFETYMADGSFASYCVPLLNDNGAVVEMSVFGPDDELRSLTKYNEKELVVEQHDYLNDKHTITKSEYDEKNNMIKSELYDENGKLQEGTEWEYSEEGVLLKVSYYGEDGIGTVEEYDENGVVVKASLYDENGRVLRETEFDNKGYSTKDTYYEYDETGALVARKVYENDSTGKLNIIVYNADGEIVNVNE